MKILLFIIVLSSCIHPTCIYKNGVYYAIPKKEITSTHEVFVNNIGQRFEVLKDWKGNDYYVNSRGRKIILKTKK